MSVENHFVDTNVLVYAYDRSAEGKHTRAQQLLRTLWENGNGCLSIQVLQEFHNVITRRVSIPLTLQQSQKIIHTYDVWHIHSPTVTDVLAAIDLQNRWQTSFWDALILQSASSLQCVVLWSEDLSDRQFYGSVQVRNPFGAI